MSRRRLAVPLLALGLSACAATRPEQPVLFASSPPGALVLIDGERSGFATPCLVSLLLERAYLVELELPGYVVATRYVVPDGTEEAILWSEMNVGHRTPHFPIFLNVDDFFVTVVTKNPKVPGRIFVRLKREADLEAVTPAEEAPDTWVETPADPPADEPAPTPDGEDGDDSP